MAVKTPVALTEAGPDGNASWQELQFNHRVGAATIDTTGIEVVIGIIPSADTALGGAQPNPEALSAGAAIGRLVSAKVATDADLAANADLSLQILVYAQVGPPATVWGSVYAYGWAADDTTGTPLFSKFTSVNLPANASNTKFGPNLASGILVIPGQVVTAKLVAFDDTVAWPGGQLSARFV